MVNGTMRMLKWLTYCLVRARILPVVQDLAEGIVIAGSRSRAPDTQGGMHISARRIIAQGLMARRLQLFRGDAVPCAYGLRVNMYRPLCCTLPGIAA